MRDLQPQTGLSIADTYRVPTLMRGASGDEERAAVIAGIRAVAQMLEDHPELPTPYSTTAQAGDYRDPRDEQEWQQQRAIVVAAAAALGVPLDTDTDTRASAEVKIVGYDVRYLVLATRRARELDVDTERSGGEPGA